MAATRATHGTYLTTRINSLPDFFLGGGVYICVSERCADVFRQFDLGQGALHPVEMWQGNGKSRITEEPFFVLTFGCHKRAFLPELSNPKRFKKFGPEVDPFWLPQLLSDDDDTAVSATALKGPDLWLDPTVQNVFFMSAELERALKAAKVARNIRRSRCRVIEG